MEFVPKEANDAMHVALIRGYEVQSKTTISYILNNYISYLYSLLP